MLPISAVTLPAHPTYANLGFAMNKRISNANSYPQPTITDGGYREFKARISIEHYQKLMHLCRETNYSGSEIFRRLLNDATIESIVTASNLQEFQPIDREALKGQFDDMFENLPEWTCKCGIISQRRVCPTCDETPFENSASEGA